MVPLAITTHFGETTIVEEVLHDQQVHLCDFGLARIKQHSTTIASPNDLGTPTGTLRWMAPEQMLYGVTGYAADMYSFGMTIYEVQFLLLIVHNILTRDTFG